MDIRYSPRNRRIYKLEKELSELNQKLIRQSSLADFAKFIQAEKELQIQQAYLLLEAE